MPCNHRWIRVDGDDLINSYWSCFECGAVDEGEKQKEERQKMKKILIFDTETTGIFDYTKRCHEEGQPRMIQLSAHLFEPGNDIPFQSFTAPVIPKDWTIDESLVKKLGHGMTTDWLKEHGQPIEFILDVYEAMHKQADLITAFGVAFDTKVMRAELRRAGREDLYKAKDEFCIMRALTKFCKMPPTEKMVAAGMTQFKTPKLSEAVDILLNEKLDGAHSADVDAFASIRLYNWGLKNKEKQGV